MCFSATASFGAGIVLTGVGVFAASKVSTPKQWAFAAIPAIFALQQFAEGFVWLSLTQASWADWIRPSTLIFLFFAEVLWPMWIPLAMLLLEKDQRTRRVFRIAFALGSVFGMHSLYYLLSNTYDVRIADHHILYKLHFPLPFVVFTWIAYGIGTVMPAFVSSVPKMWVFGLPMALSFLVALVFYPGYVISVWCFFAAVLSVVVVWVLEVLRKGKVLL